MDFQSPEYYTLTERQSARMSKIRKWRLKPVWHRMLYSCTHVSRVDIKGLISIKDSLLHFGLSYHIQKYYGVLLCMHKAPWWFVVHGGVLSSGCVFHWRPVEGHWVDLAAAPRLTSAHAHSCGPTTVQCIYNKCPILCVRSSITGKFNQQLPTSAQHSISLGEIFRFG